MPGHTDNVLRIATALKKRMGRRRQDESPNLGEFDGHQVKSFPEWGRNKVVHPVYLSRVEIWEGFQASDE